MFDRIYLYFAMLVGSYGNIRLAWYILMVQVGICLHVRNQLVGQIRSWLASTEPIHIYLQAELFVVVFFSFQFFFGQPLKTRFCILDCCKGFTCWWGLLTFALFPSISWNEQQVSLGEEAMTRVWKVHFLCIHLGAWEPTSFRGKALEWNPPLRCRQRWHGGLVSIPFYCLFFLI